MTTFLYLDLDGVLHPDAVYLTGPEPGIGLSATLKPPKGGGKSGATGLELRAPGKILMHADILIETLGYHPEVEVILSTSWVNRLGYETTLDYLPARLRERVTGTTWSEDGLQVGTYSYSRLHKLTRFQQIWAHVYRHGVTNWLAIDDLHSGSEPWPAAHKDHLIRCNQKTGLGDPEVQAALNAALLSRQYG